MLIKHFFWLSALLLSATLHCPSHAAARTQPGLVLQMGQCDRPSVYSTKSAGFSPDGRLLAGVALDRSVKLWDARTGLILRTWTMPNYGLEAVAFSPDGATVAAGGNFQYHGSICLWDVQSGRLLRRVIVPGNDTVGCLEFSPDGRFLVGGNYDGTMIVLAARDLRLQRTWNGGKYAVNALAVSSDGHTAVTGGYHGEVQMWDLSSGMLLRKLAWPDTPVLALVFSPDGRLVVGGGKTIEVWDARTGLLRETLGGGTDSITALAFSPNGKTLISGGKDVTRWDTTTWTQRQQVPGNAGVVMADALSNGGDLALGGSKSGGALSIYNARTGHIKMTLAGCLCGVTSVAFAPDGNSLAVAFDSGTGRNPVCLLDARTGRLQRMLTVPGLDGAPVPYLCDSVMFSPDGTRLATWSIFKPAYLWDTRTGLLHSVIEDNPTDPFTRLSFLPDGTLVDCGRSSIRMRDPNTGRLQRQFSSQGALGQMVVSFDGKFAVTVSDTRQQSSPKRALLQFWDLAAGTITRTLPVGTAQIIDVAFSPDGKWVAEADRDSMIRVWDPVTGQLRCALQGHNLTISALAFSPDGRTLASASLDETVKLWDAATGRLLHTLIGHFGPINSLAISSDGRRLASGSDDGRIKVWDMRTGRLLATLVVFAPILPGHQTGEWMASTPDGYYEATAGALQFMRWRVGDKLFPASAYANSSIGPIWCRRRSKEDREHLRSLFTGVAILATLMTGAIGAMAQVGFSDSLRRYSDSKTVSFRIGTAVSLRGTQSRYPVNGYQPGLLTGSTQDRAYQALIRGQFNQIEPSNELKMMSLWTGGVARVNGHYVARTNLEDADGPLRQTCAWAEAQKPRLTVRGHCMVYFQDYTLPKFPANQPPLFVKEADGRRILNAPYQPSDVRDLLRSYVQQVVDATMAENSLSRTRDGYKVISVWDVTNEVVSDNVQDAPLPGLGFAYRRTDPWYANGPRAADGTGGYDYVSDIYKWAAQERQQNVGKTITGRKITAADGFALYYNDYDLEWNAAKMTQVRNMIRHIRQGGGVVDGLGFQAHIQATALDVKPFDANIQAAIADHLRFSVTEADCAINAPPAPGDPTLAQQETNQGQEFGALVGLCVAHQKSCDCFQIWGATDDGSWIQNREATPVTRWVADTRPGPTHGKSGYWPKEGQFDPETRCDPVTGELDSASGHIVSDAYSQILAALKTPEGTRPPQKVF